MSDYRNEHWAQVKRIMRYIKQTTNYKIRYRKGHGKLNLEGFSDSDWAADPISRKSLGSYVFMLAEGPVSWACKCNHSVCLSSTEAEYKALTSAAKETIWILRCLADIRHEQEQATLMHCDNQGAIALSNNPVYHSRTKHISVYHHFIRDVVAEKEVKLGYINTLKNSADLLTKALPSELHLEHCCRLGLVTSESKREGIEQGRKSEERGIIPQSHTAKHTENKRSTIRE